jgi:predicted nucleic acid-binding protein
MVARPRVLFDLNIILDVLQRREPFYEMSARSLASAETGRIEGLVAAHSLTTLFYLMARDQSANQARITLGEILRFLAVAAVDHSIIEQALTLPYRDFEDAVQMIAAVHAGAGYLVTRDTADFRAGPLPALQPAELLALLE